jgi:hypothetical protein
MFLERPDVFGCPGDSYRLRERRKARASEAEAI